MTERTYDIRVLQNQCIGSWSRHLYLSLVVPYINPGQQYGAFTTDERRRQPMSASKKNHTQLDPSWLLLVPPHIIDMMRGNWVTTLWHEITTGHVTLTFLMFLVLLSLNRQYAASGITVIMHVNHVYVILIWLLALLRMTSPNQCDIELNRRRPASEQS